MTSIKGLEGILSDGMIRHDAEGHALSSKDGDACERCGAISVLDFATATEAELFDSWQNWTGVFDFHKPSIVLTLRSPKVLPNLRRLSFEEALRIGGRYIIEAEACHIGNIEGETVTEGWIVGARMRIVFRSRSLEDVLKVAKRSEHGLRRRKHSIFGWQMPKLDDFVSDAKDSVK